MLRKLEKNIFLMHFIVKFTISFLYSVISPTYVFTYINKWMFNGENEMAIILENMTRNEPTVLNKYKKKQTNKFTLTLYHGFFDLDSDLLCDGLDFFELYFGCWKSSKLNELFAEANEATSASALLLFG